MDPRGHSRSLSETHVQSGSEKQPQEVTRTQSGPISLRPSSPSDTQMNRTWVYEWLKEVYKKGHTPLIYFCSSNTNLLTTIINSINEAPDPQMAGIQFDLRVLPSKEDDATTFEVTHNRQYACVIADTSADLDWFFKSHYIRRGLAQGTLRDNQQPCPDPDPTYKIVPGQSMTTSFMSSGSTGKPKWIKFNGCPHLDSKGPWQPWFSAFKDLFSSLEQEYTVISLFASGFDAFIFTMLMSNGGHFIAASELSIEEIVCDMLSLLKQNKTPVFCALPSSLNHLMSAIEKLSPENREYFQQPWVAFTTGAEAQFEQLHRVYPNVIGLDAYGPTEAVYGVSISAVYSPSILGMTKEASRQPTRTPFTSGTFRTDARGYLCPQPQLTPKLGCIIPALIRSFFKFHQSQIQRKDITITTLEDNSLTIHLDGMGKIETGDVVSSTKSALSGKITYSLTNRRLVWFKTPSGQKVNLRAIEGLLTESRQDLKEMDLNLSIIHVHTGIVLILEHQEYVIDELKRVANLLTKVIEEQMTSGSIPRFPVKCAYHNFIPDEALSTSTHFGKTISYDTARQIHHTGNWANHPGSSATAHSPLPPKYQTITKTTTLNPWISQVHYDITNRIVAHIPKSADDDEAHLSQSEIPQGVTLTELGFGSKNYMQFLHEVIECYTSRVTDEFKQGISAAIKTLISNHDITVFNIVSGIISICIKYNARLNHTIKTNEQRWPLPELSCFDSGWKLEKVNDSNHDIIVCPDMSGTTRWFNPIIDKFPKFTKSPGEAQSSGIWLLKPSPLFPLTLGDLKKVLRETIERQKVRPKQAVTFSTSYTGVTLSSLYPELELELTLTMLDPVSPELTFPTETMEGHEAHAIDFFINNMSQLATVTAGTTEEVKKSNDRVTLLKALQGNDHFIIYGAWLKLLENYQKDLGTNLTQLCLILQLSYDKVSKQVEPLRVTNDVVYATKIFSEALSCFFTEKQRATYGGYKMSRTTVTLSINGGCKHLELPLNERVVSWVLGTLGLNPEPKKALGFFTEDASKPQPLGAVNRSPIPSP